METLDRPRRNVIVRLCNRRAIALVAGAALGIRLLDSQPLPLNRMPVAAWEWPSEAF